MASPILTLTDINDVQIPVLNFGTYTAGAQKGAISVRIWNNQSNATGISDAINPTITTKTLNGFDSGDSVANGNEIVVNQYLQVMNISAGATAWSAVGGANVSSISDSAPQPGNSPPPAVIHSNGFAGCLLRLAIPLSATQGNAQFVCRVAFMYQ